MPLEDRLHYPVVLDMHEKPRGREWLLQVPAGLAWFDGHFPGRPVLPGVVQADWAIYYGRALGFDPAGFRGFPRIKFKAVIRPDMVVRLLLTAAGSRRLDFAYESSAVLHSEGRVEYAEPLPATR